ncbi:hypothetical protein AB0D46_15690 [Streptomyces sp. NPDC048383]|uniref:hypothetical protein n=1 Tax=Streptomyces sp. NPDC048383 TaxID=3155386 RepID=UPI00341B12D0
MSSPDDHDPSELFTRWWATYTAIDDDDGMSPDKRPAVMAPSGQTWPGLAPRREDAADSSPGR